MVTPFLILPVLQEVAPVQLSDRFIVAISGGVDSVVLAYLCKAQGLRIELAHCNFQLRGAESDRDEASVRKLAADWQLPVSVRAIDLKSYANKHQLSIQEAAREFRYAWFNEMAIAGPTPCWILTAHHADDNAETVAMNFFRGTGLAGLTGIPPRTGWILRPLLSLRKTQLLDIASENDLPSVADSSNADEKYTRNYFRHSIFPALEKVYPAVKENLIHNIERFTAIESLYRQCMDRLRATFLIKKGKERKVSIRALQRYPGDAFLYELFSPFGFSAGQIQEIKKLFQATTGAQLVAADGSHRLFRNRNFLLLAQGVNPHIPVFLLETLPKSFPFGNNALQGTTFSYAGEPPPHAVTVAWLDAHLALFPLILRRWKTGDYFYPLGMRKKKKLSRFFIDQKLSLPDKENIWVLESRGKIVWVVGMRIDERFKITPATKQVLCLELVSI